MGQGSGQEVAATGAVPIAHSARDGIPAQTYADHVNNVRKGTTARLAETLRFAINPPSWLATEVEQAAIWHDLGKLDAANQAGLRRGKGGQLEWDHIDAGVAHLTAIGHPFAAWLVRAHHSPGLPAKEAHFKPFNRGNRLRGRRGSTRKDKDHDHLNKEQIGRTDAHLQNYVAAHRSTVPDRVTPIAATPADVELGHGLTMRLALSCLVDADHQDTAQHYSGTSSQSAVDDPRWEERLEQLTRYVRAMQAGDTADERARNNRRREFFEACLASNVNDPLVACEGPVGIGKTTAVVAYLIQQAIRHTPRQRRLIIVAPYTNILSQTAKRLRAALVLPGERADEIVVEHHHRADFEDERDRDLAVLWRAPIVLTTAVSFFETLSAASPATLRKLHAVPGSAVFIDEAHAALPATLWPQNWKWIGELARSWNCRFVMASGSLARFWEDPQIVKETCKLPELMPKQQADDAHEAERNRVRYSTLQSPSDGGSVLTVAELVAEVLKRPGPRLVIVNTVQTAAVVARHMREKISADRVLHLSTALTPNDRGRMLDRVIAKLRSPEQDWVLVATSCVEAGVDLSFQTAFRERFAVASTIQTGGRVNRHNERSQGYVFDFALKDIGITEHPAAKISAHVLQQLMNKDALNLKPPAEVVSEAMRREILEKGGLGHQALTKAENERDYPEAQKAGRVITGDTHLVVVEPQLRADIAARVQVSFRRLLSGSVQLWTNRISKLGLQPIQGHTDIYEWTDLYDVDFDGIMAGVLRTEAFLKDGGAIL